MDLDHLPGQTGTQVTARALHDTQQAGDIVGDLGTATILFVVDRRKVIFQVDTRAHRPHRQQNPFQHLTGRVLVRVIGDQEHAAIEKGALTDRTAADNRRCVGRVAQLRPRLAEITGAPGDVPAGLRQGRVIRCRRKPPAAFVGRAQGGDGQVLFQPRKIFLQLFRQHVTVIPGNGFVAGVVFRTQYPAIVRQVDTAFAQQGADFGTVGHGGKRARVRSPVLATAGAAIVGRQVRVVLAGRPVAHHHHQWRKILLQTNVAQKSLHPVRLLAVGKTKTRMFRCRLLIRMFCGNSNLCRHRSVEAYL